MRQFHRSIVAVCAAISAAAFAHAERAEELTDDASLIAFLDELAEATYQFNIGNAEPYLAAWERSCRTWR